MLLSRERPTDVSVGQVPNINDVSVGQVPNINDVSVGQVPNIALFI